MPLGVKEMSHWFEVDGQLLRARRPPRATPRKRSSRHPTVDRPFGRDELPAYRISVPDRYSARGYSLTARGDGLFPAPRPVRVQVAISVASPDRIQVAFRSRPVTVPEPRLP